MAQPLEAPDEGADAVAPLARLGESFFLPDRMASSFHALVDLPTTMLLSGEPGVGKSLAARALHRASRRRDKPFHAVNCSALSTGRLDREILARTVKASSRAGHDDLLGGGTIFLDEIDALDIVEQRGLMILLDELEGERTEIGSRPSRGARVIAATRRDLRRAVSERSFRPELFSRIAVIELRLPSLRDQLDSLAQLVDIGLARSARRLGREAPKVSPDFMQRLSSHSWPGNVRELFSLLDHVVTALPSRQRCLDASDLAGLLLGSDSADRSSQQFLCARCGDAVAQGGTRLDWTTDSAIETVLRATGGNISRAARRLGLARSTLRYRIQRAGLAHLVPRD